MVKNDPLKITQRDLEGESQKTFSPLHIISGGQTGVDRRALDWAIANNIPHRGFCPKGRIAEDGVIPSVYRLTETTSPEYPPRTEKNVEMSDGTVLISLSSRLSRGTRLTAKYANKHGKPVLHVHAGTDGPGEQLAEFIRQHKIARLNVAGPRASSEPHAGEFAVKVLGEALAALKIGETPLTALDQHL